MRQPFDITARGNLMRQRVEPIWCRHIVHGEISDLVRLDELVNPFPWDHEMFRHELRQAGTIARVADLGEGGPPDVAGFMVYQLAAAQLRILRFGVHPDWQRMGIASRMLAKLREKVTFYGRLHSITTIVPESCLSMCLFLRARGFRCSRVLRGEFGDEDGLAFGWSRECGGR